MKNAASFWSSIIGQSLGYSFGCLEATITFRQLWRAENIYRSQEFIRRL